MPDAKAVILLVDDDPDFIAIAAHHLQAAGYDIAVAHDPDSALAVLAQRRCDLVISDLMMTNLDSGFSLAQRIKTDPRLRNLPVIIATSARSVSGFDFRPFSREDLDHMHADAFFEKPLPPDQLLGTVEKLIRRPPR